MHHYHKLIQNMFQIYFYLNIAKQFDKITSTTEKNVHADQFRAAPQEKANFYSGFRWRHLFGNPPHDSQTQAAFALLHHLVRSHERTLLVNAQT